jgi:hypothetical protein
MLFKVQYSSFSLGMITYSYESGYNLFRFELKRLPGFEHRSLFSFVHVTTIVSYINNNTYIHYTYHSRLISKEIAETFQIFRRDAHVLPKMT